MTNEEKARQIAECCSVMPPTSIKQSDVIAMTNNAAMQAMEWKDEQWKKRLQYMFIGGWTASLDIDNCSPKCTTKISFVKEDYGV